MKTRYSRGRYPRLVSTLALLGLLGQAVPSQAGWPSPTDEGNRRTTAHAPLRRLSLDGARTPEPAPVLRTPAGSSATAPAPYRSFVTDFRAAPLRLADGKRTTDTPLTIDQATTSFYYVPQDGQPAPHGPKAGATKATPGPGTPTTSTGRSAAKTIAPAAPRLGCRLTTHRRTVARPKGTAAGAHAKPTGTLTAMVNSINRANASPTNASNVDFTVTFSQSITGLTTANFALVTTGLTGVSFNGLSGSGSTYTITVHTGTGSGTLQLDMVNDTGVAPSVSNVPLSGQVYNIDKTAPAPPVVLVPANGTSTNDNTPTYSGTAEPFSTVNVLVNGIAEGIVTANAAGNWAFIQPGALPDGIHTVRATATDPAGNTGPASNIITFTIDATRPAVVISSTASDPTSISPIPITVTFSESVTGFLASEVTLTNGTLSGFAGSGTTYTFNVTPLASGLVTVNVAANVAQDAVTNGNTAAAPFSITYSAPTVWTSNAGTTNWFTAGNWTLGVPTATLSALIPVVGSGRYPLISAGTGATRDLILNSGASLNLTGGTLTLAGTLLNNGTVNATGGGVTLNGGGTQVISGSSTTNFFNLTIATAGGVVLTQHVAVQQALTLTTGVLTTGARQVTLAPTGTLSESATSYVTGTVQTTRNLNSLVANAFGGLGLILTPAGLTLPGSTLVRRVTGTALTGQGASVSIKRYYDIQPTTNLGLNVAMSFGYADAELNGLSESQLNLYRSTTGTSGPWQPRGFAVRNAVTNTVTLLGISSFSIWTLGGDMPLPVELAAFTAERHGTSALLRWTTAQEQNNERFEVEASTDGHTFRRLGAVAGAGNSTSPSTYAFTDARLAAHGAALVYYRLRQVDRDGLFDYSPVRTVAVALGPGGLAVYPNPARTAATVTGATPGAPVALYDALGRLVLTTTADDGGTTPLALPTGRPAGLYVVRTGGHALRLTVE